MLAPLLTALQQREKGQGRGKLGLLPFGSELLQATVHLSLALLPCPGPALGAELL